MKKKNGFTLIELLAVIVILAIIALIATPIVLNLINKARQGAAKDSAYGVRKAGQLYYQKSLIDSPNGLSDDVTVSFNNGVITLTNGIEETNFELDGTKPSGGSITITKDGEVSGTVVINGYNCTIPNIGNVECFKGNSGTTPSESEQDVTTPTPIVTPSEPQSTFGGELLLEEAGSTKTYKGIAYLDPADLTAECDSLTTLTSTNTGCKKFYIFDDSNNEYKMIMDRNTTAKVAWVTKDDYLLADGTEEDWNNYNRNSKGPLTVNAQLAIDTVGWNGSPRLITANELAHIVGADSNDTIKWSQSKTYGTDDTSTKSSWLYFDGSGTTYSSSDGWQKQVANSATPSNYAWLFAYTNGCESYGCNTADSSTYGYWTSDAVVGYPRYAWGVNSGGRLYHYIDVNLDTYCGVRPVITLDKSIFN